jgi:hypothetical protein
MISRNTVLKETSLPETTAKPLPTAGNFTCILACFRRFKWQIFPKKTLTNYCVEVYMFRVVKCVIRWDKNVFGKV